MFECSSDKQFEQFAIEFTRPPFSGTVELSFGSENGVGQIDLLSRGVIEARFSFLSKEGHEASFSVHHYNLKDALRDGPPSAAKYLRRNNLWRLQPYAFHQDDLKVRGVKLTMRLREQVIAFQGKNWVPAAPAAILVAA